MLPTQHLNRSFMSTLSAISLGVGITLNRLCHLRVNRCTTEVGWHIRGSQKLTLKRKTLVKYRESNSTICMVSLIILVCLWMTGELPLRSFIAISTPQI